MADKKTETKTIEREYIIPLRKEWRKVANYRRAGRAAKFIKQFIARHMKVPNRDTSKVKLDLWLNQELWFRGKSKPPAKIKVKVKKEGELVKVELAELPEFVKFEKAKRERVHKPAEKPKASEKPTEEKKEEKTEEQKKEEKEKATSAAEQKAAEAKAQSKAQAKATKIKQTPIHRKALKK